MQNALVPATTIYLAADIGTANSTQSDITRSTQFQIVIDPPEDNSHFDWYNRANQPTQDLAEKWNCLTQYKQFPKLVKLLQVLSAPELLDKVSANDVVK